MKLASAADCSLHGSASFASPTIAPSANYPETASASSSHPLEIHLSSWLQHLPLPLLLRRAPCAAQQSAHQACQRIHWRFPSEFNQRNQALQFCLSMPYDLASRRVASCILVLQVVQQRPSMQPAVEDGM
jgi:hypothetical protein